MFTPRQPIDENNNDRQGQPAYAGADFIVIAATTLPAVFNKEKKTKKQDKT